MWPIASIGHMPLPPTRHNNTEPNTMKKLLLLTDQQPGANHSSVEGLFHHGLGHRYQVELVFFGREITAPLRRGNRLLLPRAAQRRQLAEQLGRLVDLRSYDIVVVRNQFPVLAQLLRCKLPAKIGFWESFPHSYRRKEQALRERRAVLRKSVEYWFKARKERRLIEQCAFYLPITETHRRVFYPDLSIPCHPTPMGFDFARYGIAEKPQSSGPIRFVYIGAIDALRQLDLVNQAFMSVKGDFRLDYYSNSRNAIVEQIKQLPDPRIRFHAGLPRDQLFAAIADADVGVCFFPETKTYITASPTKMLEYCALNMTVLGNLVPEYEGLLDDECSYLCPLNGDTIAESVARILATPRETLRHQGEICGRRIRQSHDYRQMAAQLGSFLDTLMDS